MTLKALKTGLMATLLTTSLGTVAVAAETKARMAAFWPETSPIYPGYSLNPKKIIEEASGGAVEITVFPSNTLVKPKDAYQSTQFGISDITPLFSFFAPGAFPLYEIASLPGLFNNPETANAILNDLVAKHPEFDEAFSPKVTHIISQVQMGVDVHSRVEIRSLADFKGLKIGAQDPQAAAALKAMGASVSQMKALDAYTSLERGVIDAYAGGWGLVNATRLEEVTKFHVKTNLSRSSLHWLISGKFWAKLSPEAQEIIAGSGAQLQAGSAKSNMMIEMGMTKKVTAKGNEVVELSVEDHAVMRDMFKPMWAAWADKMEAKGLPGKAVLADALALIDQHNGS